MEELRALYEPVRRFAAVVGSWDVDPDDLVQDAYARVLLRNGSEIRDLGPYLRRTVMNLATDERRRSARARRALHRLDAAAEMRDTYPSDLVDLLRVPPQVRALLFLVEVEGHAIAAAAPLVGMSHANARVALMRARRKLRSQLMEEASGE